MADRIQFGDFELDTRCFELRRGMQRIKLERIPMELLILLAGSGGRLVERREVVKAIWGQGHFLESESAVNTAVRKLRRVLGDDAKQPVFIETVPGKGYRFLVKNSVGWAAHEGMALYQRGLHYWNRKTPESYLEAIRLYQKSIDADPDQPLPYLGLAKTWIMFGIHGLQPPHDVYPRARAAVAKTLEIDPLVAEAHASMGDIVKGYDWDWARAEKHYLRALELDPQCAVAHQWYANLLSIVGRHEEALRHATEARMLEPLSVGPAGFVGFTLLRAGRYREALRQSETALTLEPNSPIANWFLGQAFTALEQFGKAQEAFSAAVENSHGANMYLAALGHVYGASGKVARAAEVLGKLEQLAGERYVSPLDLGIVCIGLERIDAAFEYLSVALEQRVMRLTELAMPMFKRLRGDPRYDEIVGRVGL
ncbi:MAG TPA: tetratricopeptide repeat protein [Silvibacterium sp.]|nr:tetratricopeptide repeat protein [Silvibacterium sp.]